MVESSKTSRKKSMGNEDTFSRVMRIVDLRKKNISAMHKKKKMLSTFLRRTTLLRRE
jgi:hypothetical protein